MVSPVLMPDLAALPETDCERWRAHDERRAGLSVLACRHACCSSAVAAQAARARACQARTHLDDQAATLCRRFLEPQTQRLIDLHCDLLASRLDLHRCAASQRRPDSSSRPERGAAAAEHGVLRNTWQHQRSGLRWHACQAAGCAAGAGPRAPRPQLAAPPGAAHWPPLAPSQRDPAARLL